jgi:hypothetical protein
MHALRDSTVRRLLAAIASLALYLQLAFAGPGMLALSVSPDTVGSLAEHALCLAAPGGERQQPADNGPAAPVHDHSDFCCLWHPLSGLASQTTATPLPVGYASVTPSELGTAALISGPRHRPANARAPPIPA